MSEGKQIILEINAIELMKAFDAVEKRRKEVEAASEKTISMIDKKSKWTFRRVYQVAKTSWYIIDNLLQSMDKGISAQFRMMINAGFAAINIMQPIIAAQAVTPGMQIQAALGAMQLQIAYQNILMAEASQKSMEGAFDLMHALRGIDNLIGFLEFQ